VGGGAAEFRVHPAGQETVVLSTRWSAVRSPASLELWSEWSTLRSLGSNLCTFVKPSRCFSSKNYERFSVSFTTKRFTLNGSVFYGFQSATSELSPHYLSSFLQSICLPFYSLSVLHSVFYLSSFLQYICLSFYLSLF